MIDEITRDQLRVSTDGVAGPYLMVPMTQLARVREVLDLHGVHYWPDADAISLDGRPAIAVINFGRAGDTIEVPTLTDIQTRSYERFLQLDVPPEKRQPSGLEGVLRDDKIPELVLQNDRHLVGEAALDRGRHDHARRLGLEGDVEMVLADQACAGRVG